MGRPSDSLYRLTLPLITGAPSARSGHAAAWTGSKLIVWGGLQGGSHLSDGAIYDPAEKRKPYGHIRTALQWPYTRTGSKAIYLLNRHQKDALAIEANHFGFNVTAARTFYATTVAGAYIYSNRFKREPDHTHKTTGCARLIDRVR